MFDNYSRPHSRQPLLRWGYNFPKYKLRDAKHSLKCGGISKRGKGHKRWGVWEMFEMQKVALQKQE